MIKLLNGDCLDLLDEVEDNSVDMILTDPPYNISQEGNNLSRSTLDSNLLRRESPIVLDFGEWDRMDDKEFLQFTDEWFSKCCKKLKDGGAFVSFYNKENISWFHWNCQKNGLRTRTIFSWHKTNPAPSFRQVNYLSACEFVWIGSKGDGKWKFNFGYQKDMHNFMETPNASSYGVTDHPTEKPLQLINHFLKIHTNEGDTVLDPFMGSGTTGVGCQQLGRNFIGIEKDEHYFNIAKQRIENEGKKEDLF